jgi:methionine synthase II (cobalamin-independent)
MIDGWAADKDNKTTLDELLDTYIAHYNDCFSSHADKIHFGLHICRGNFKGSRHFSEGGYDRIATLLFQKLCFHTYYLEYDTERAGGFEPLQQLPAHKRVVLGVVSRPPTRRCSVSRSRPSVGLRATRRAMPSLGTVWWPSSSLCVPLPMIFGRESHKNAQCD